MSNARKVTCELIEAVENGLLSWESIARSSLSYMSEADVKDMAESDNLIEEEELKTEIIIDFEFKCNDCGTNTGIFHCSIDDGKSDVKDMQEIDLCSDCVEVRNG